MASRTTPKGRVHLAGVAPHGEPGDSQRLCTPPTGLARESRRTVSKTQGLPPTRAPVVGMAPTGNPCHPPFSTPLILRGCGDSPRLQYMPSLPAGTIGYASSAAVRAERQSSNRITVRRLLVECPTKVLAVSSGGGSAREEDGVGGIKAEEGGGVGP